MYSYDNLAALHSKGICRSFYASMLQGRRTANGPKLSMFQRKSKHGFLAVLFFFLCFQKDLKIRCVFVCCCSPHAHIHTSFKKDEVTPFSLCLQELGDAHLQISKSRCCSWAVPLCQCATNSHDGQTENYIQRESSKHVLLCAHLMCTLCLSSWPR